MSSNIVRDIEIVPLICDSIARRKSIHIEDVRALAKFCDGDVRLTTGEAEAVFALAAARHPSCPEWSEYFSETMGHWFVAVYAGHNVTVNAARQLIAWLGGRDARLDSARFRLLTHVLEQTPLCPEELLSFARGCLARAMDIGEPAANARSA